MQLDEPGARLKYTISVIVALAVLALFLATSVRNSRVRQLEIDKRHETSRAYSNEYSAVAHLKEVIGDYRKKHGEFPKNMDELLKSDPTKSEVVQLHDVQRIVYYTLTTADKLTPVEISSARAKYQVKLRSNSWNVEVVHK